MGEGSASGALSIDTASASVVGDGHRGVMLKRYLSSRTRLGKGDQGDRREMSGLVRSTFSPQLGD